MEPRKIFKSGKGSYILTLPKKWVEENNLKDGDYVYVLQSKDSLKIFAKGMSKKALVDLKNLEFNEIIRRIISYYLAGFDVLRIKIYSDEQRTALVLATEMLIGMEIIEDVGSEIELVIYIEPSKVSFEDVLEKYYRVCISMFEDFLSVLKDLKKSLVSSISFREYEIDRLCFLLLRLAGTRVHHRTFIRIIERIADHINSMAEALLKLEKMHEELLISFKVLNILKFSLLSFLKSEIKIAEDVLRDAENVKREIQNVQSLITKYDKEEILLLKTIFDGLSRVLAYSCDVAETTINYVVAELM
ncbi:MAG: phosphate uptake regulator PhoU [Archaeoglobaceae archaeon]|nr:phosphate uptake regulator PhoU [Archaeoglobaceae archaeon]MCX8152382.1 phosphate uptake regulator PhoU [Archaeoglobaceae archaeon]MDW8013722.1 phosphate uptake regulator PhoU [Archaeoglobaceae archaeon]